MTCTMEDLLVKTSAPGKVILFGEHSVVHGKLAVATSLEYRTFVEIFKKCTPDILITFDKFNSPLLLLPPTLPEDVDSIDGNVKKSYLVLRQLWMQLELNKIDFGIHLVISSELPMGSGMGSSASFSVALSAALLALKYISEDTENELLKLDSQEGKKIINNLAFDCERLFHGTPSGIDNEICVCGGAVSFMRNENGNMQLNKLEISDSIRVIVVDSGKSRNTSKVVEETKSLINQHSEVCKNVLNAMHLVAETSINCLSSDNFTQLKELVRFNQGLLYAIGVSDLLLDEIGLIAEKFNLSWKLTGAGRGGNALIFLPPGGFSNLEQLLTELKEKGFKTYVVKLGSEGVKISWRRVLPHQHSWKVLVD